MMIRYTKAGVIESGNKNTMFDETVCSEFTIDKNYFLWLTYTTESGKVWYITSDILRTEYQLWKDKKRTKYKSDNPTDLYKYIKE